MDLTSNVTAIVLDLDGTLLNSQKEVSKRNLQAILECYRKGITVIFATARPPRSVKAFLPQELQEIAAIVYYNGALIIDNTSEYRQHYPIESAITNEIIEYVITHHSDACLSIESEDTWYSNRSLDYSKSMNTIVNPIVVSLHEFKRINASKLLISEYPYYENLHKQFEHKVNTVCTDSGTLIQIMAKGVSKKQAIMDLCVQNHIPMNSIMAFGDDWNDLELFHACGFPIAMENAIRELKAIAYFVTKSNDEDGVAQVLEKLICTVNNS
ncbi:hydrolase [Bacillus sp. AFS018417]|uniref:HAD family hydrolase n=1 Tax=unclassified Bacillus (in: firmicutes) TaxID=185979 RepID=UPI000BF7D238|nr:MULTISPECIES: HAD family hydrolase [unclassified Bacillus (in: firmicutes)]MCP1123948.1 Cof-type HAD-IIB family hydrolase [Bacillus sp. 3103sda1]PEZ03740.1 hydrolase [Bacillus sp. AFS018417]